MKLLNLTYLKEVVENNESSVRSIIDLFVKQMPEEILLIEKAMEEQDYNAIKGVSHKLKSSVTILGVEELLKVLNALEENAGEKKDLSEIQELFLQLRELSNKLLEEINQQFYQ